MFIKNKKGFTLIELIVVVAIIGILAGLGSPKFMGHIQEAKLTSIVTDIVGVEMVSDIFYMKHNRFPVLGVAVKEEGEIAINKNKEEVEDITGFKFVDKEGTGIGGTYRPSKDNKGQFALNEETGEVVYIGKLKYKKDSNSLTKNGITIDKEGNIVGFVPSSNIVAIPDSIGGIEVKKYYINFIDATYDNDNQQFVISFDNNIIEEGTLKVERTSVGSVGDLGFLGGKMVKKNVNPNNPNQFLYKYSDEMKSYIGSAIGVLDFQYWSMQGDNFVKQYKSFYTELTNDKITNWREVTSDIVKGDYKYNDETKEVTISLERPLTPTEKSKLATNFHGENSFMHTYHDNNFVKVDGSTYKLNISNLPQGTYNFGILIWGDEYTYSITSGIIFKSGASTSNAPTEVSMEFNPINNNISATFTDGTITEANLQNYELYVTKDKQSYEYITNRILISPQEIMFNLSSLANGRYFLWLRGNNQTLINDQEIEITNSTALATPTSANAVYDADMDKIVVTFLDGGVKEEDRSKYSLEIKMGEDSYNNLSREWINSTTMYFEMRHEQVGDYIIRLVDYSKGKNIIINDFLITKVATMPKGLPSSASYEYEESNKRIVITFDSEFPSNKVNDLTITIGLEKGKTRSGYSLEIIDSNKVSFNTKNLIINGEYVFEFKYDTTDTIYIEGNIIVTNGQFEINEMPNDIISIEYKNEEMIVTFNKNLPEGFNRIRTSMRTNGKQSFDLTSVVENRATFKLKTGQQIIPIGQVNEINIRIDGWLSKSINVTF